MASNARTSLVCVSDTWQAPWYTACANCSVFPVWEWYTISNVFTGAHVQVASQLAVSLRYDTVCCGGSAASMSSNRAARGSRKCGKTGSPYSSSARVRMRTWVGDS